jgi:hypothetical protein
MMKSLCCGDYRARREEGKSIEKTFPSEIRAYSGRPQREILAFCTSKQHGTKYTRSISVQLMP